jgi:hypothetical protein
MSVFFRHWTFDIRVSTFDYEGASMPEQDRETKKRVCRSCNESYDYPLPRDPATRFHCSACVELPAGTRALFEKYNKRIKALAVQVERLEQRQAAK